MINIEKENLKMQAAKGLLEDISLIQSQLDTCDKTETVVLLEVYIRGRERKSIYIPGKEIITAELDTDVVGLISKIKLYYQSLLADKEEEYQAIFTAK